MLWLGGPFPGPQCPLRGSLLIGSSPSTDVSLQDGYVSARHVGLTRDRDHYHLRDLGSEFGTFVNGRVVTDHALRNGDLVEIGNSAFAFVDEARSLPAGAAKMSIGQRRPSARGPTVFLNSYVRALLLGSWECEPWIAFERLLNRLSAVGIVQRVFLATFACSSGALSEIALGRVVSERSPEDAALRILVGQPGPEVESFLRRCAARRKWRTSAAVGQVVHTPVADSELALLHAKLLLLRLGSGHSLAIVGSSNASFAGYIENCEMNVAFAWRFGDPHGFEATAEELWHRSTPLEWESPGAEALGRSGKLRPFHWQRSRIRALRALWRAASAEEPRRACELRGYTLEMPPATGKTLVAVELLRPALNAGRRVLWLAHRRALLAQAASTIARQLGPKARTADVFALKRRDDVDPPCILLATDAGLWRHLAKASRVPFDIIVVDEVHRYGAGRYSEILKRVRTRLLVGLSATPARRGRGPQRRAFEERFPRTCVVERMPLSAALRLRERGRPVLARVRHVSCDSGWVMRVPSEDPWSLEFHERRQIRHFASYFTPVVLAVYDALQTRFSEDFGPVGPTLFFAVDVAHSSRLERGLRSLIKSRGRSTWIRQYHSRIPVRGRSRAIELGRIRDEFLLRASEGEAPVLVGVDIVSEGFDIPPVQTLILCRPTLSLRLYAQMIGRGLRGPAMGGSEYCNLVHFAAQTEIAGRRENSFADIRQVLTSRSPRIETLRRLESLLSADKAIARTRRDAQIAYRKVRHDRSSRR